MFWQSIKIEEERRIRPQVGFLFMGGSHQMLHMAPVAAELGRSGDADVTAFVDDAASETALRVILRDLQADIAIELLPIPAWARPVVRARAKTPRVVGGRRRLIGQDVVVAAERTSTILKRLPGEKPYMVHIPHGAGDRAQGFEARIALFDHVIVPGMKSRERMIERGVVRPGNVSVSGYIKLAALRARSRDAAPLFANGRPTVVYNPHFSDTLSSWHSCGKALIAAFQAQDRYNLVFAPHVRLAARLSEAERAEIAAMAIEGHILIDFGSARSIDMSYTLGADIYVGDVSSQIYEFLSTPRPCVFLNPGATDWRDDPDYAFWHFGEVVTDPADILAAIDRAGTAHPHYAGRQIQAVGRAFGPMDASPIVRAAKIVRGLACQRQRARQARRRTARPAMPWVVAGAALGLGVAALCVAGARRAQHS